MTKELVIRFILGGAIVSGFAVAGERFRTKSFSGLFGAAPSVALASLGMAYASEGAETVVILGRSMMLGSMAMFVYAVACVAATKRLALPVWLVAGAAWIAWFAAALCLLASAKIAGVL
jgi:uncharacterized membrane protein (GlpM family)